MKKLKGSPIVATVTLFALLLSLSAGPLAMSHAKAESGKDKTNSPKAQTRNPSLAQYTRELTQLARQGKLQLVSGHDAEISRAIQVLSNNHQNNPVLIGESDANATEVVEGLAARIASGDVPENLRQVRLYSLNLNALLKDVKTTAELERRLNAVLSEVKGAGKGSILFINELQHFVGTRAAQTVSDLLAGATARGELRLMGATNGGAYKDYIASDAKLDGLFRQVRLDSSFNATETSESSAQKAKREDGAQDDNGFVGDKVSADLRDLMKSAKSDTDRVGVILQADDVNSGELNSLLKRYGVEVNARMAQVGALNIEVPVKAIEEIAKSGLTNHLSPNRKLESFSYGHVVMTTGTDQVRNQPSSSLISGILTTVNTTLNGSGIGIAILDSGVDTAHAAFVGRVKFSKDFTTENISNQDPYGHGTHVASSAAGVSTTNGNYYEGIAPGVSIVNLRVLNSQGVGTTSALLSALNWILSPVDPTKAVSSTNPLNKDKYSIRVVNMSLGAPAVDSYKNDPVCRASRALVDAGIVVVAAAGNNGKDANGNKIYGAIHSPGNEPSVITVGAVNTYGTDGRSDDGITTFSSRGPTRSFYTDASGVKHYDNLVKPDLAAPGNKLIYAESDIPKTTSNPNGTNLLIAQHPELDSGIVDNDNRKLMYLSGTSMATPIV
ncbi:MAG: serine protease AprX, partial [Acidobacteriota bacterium]|nr:serine protease AprX [Acidobacteriota bacterium]